MTIDYAADRTADEHRKAIAAQQVALMTGGRADRNGCYVLLAD